MRAVLALAVAFALQPMRAPAPASPEVSAKPPAPSVDWRVPARYAGKTVNGPPRGFDRRSIALTFDDGPDPRTTPQVLDELKKRNMKATFFVLGWRVEKYPALVKRMLDEGHVVANHTYMHPARPPHDRALQEIDRTSQLIKKACGKYPTIFRPPYGIRESWTAQVAKGRGMPSVLWNVSSADTATKDTAKIYKNCTAGIRPGAIILLHDIQPHSVSALPRVLDELDRQKWNCVGLVRLLREYDEFASRN